MLNQIEEIRKILDQSIDSSSERSAVYFKTGPGEYAEHEQFIGITVPVLRKIAKKFLAVSLDELKILLSSKFNEERLLALFILTKNYQIATKAEKTHLYQFYCENLKFVNNWNLVDASAHLIIGAELLNGDKNYLFELAASPSIWQRRIAIVATWHFIRTHHLDTTFVLAKALLNDQHDLIHKAVGWMLREAGKKDQAILKDFLNIYKEQMPTTMLRYAIEKFSPDERKFYLRTSKIFNNK